MIQKIFLKFSLLFKKIFKLKPSSYEFTTSLLFYNVENKNERIYLKDSIDVDELNVSINRLPMYGQINQPDAFDISLNDATHIFDKFFIENDVLYGHGKTLKNENGSLLVEMIKNNQIVFRSCATGSVNPDKTVNIEKLLSFNAILKSDDSFESDNYLTFKKL